MSPRRLLKGPHLGLILLLLVSGAVRLQGIKTNYPYMIYVDEGHVVRHALNMYRERTLDPRHYWHNTLLMTTINLVVRCIAELEGDPKAFRQSIKYFPSAGFKHKPEQETEPFYELVEPPIFLVVGRAIVAICGTLMIAVAFFLFREFLPPWPALASAALLSALPVLVMNSHYVIGDIPMSLMYTGVALCAVRWFRTQRASWLLASAILGGAAASFKMTGVISLGLPLLLLAGSSVPLSRKLLGFALLPLVTWLSFHLLCPGLWLKELEIARAMEHMSRYYAGKGESHAEHVKQLVTWQLFGVPLLALAVAGLIVSVATTKRRRLLILLTVYALLFLSFYSTQSFQPVRSVYPILPILALFTGCGVWRVAVLLSARRRARASAMAAVILFALATASGAEAISQQRRLLARSDTRIKVAAWLVDHVPRGERVAVLDLVALHPSVIRTLPGSVEVVTLADQARLLEADWVVLPALSPESEQDDRDRLDQLRARLAAQRRPLAYQTGRAAAAGQKSAFRPTGTKLSVFGPPPTRPTQPSPRTDAGK